MADLERLAVVHSLLGSSTRLGLVKALADGPKSGTALAEITGITLSGVSQHMVKFREAGLATSSRDPEHRQTINFRLTDPVHPLIVATLALLEG